MLRLSDEVQEAQGALNSIVTFKLQRPPAKGVAWGNRLYTSIKRSLDPNRTGRRLDHIYRGVRSWFHREVRERVEAAMANAGMTHLYLIVRGEQAPNPDSRVVLSADRDELGQRRANLDWRLSDLDKHTARVFADVLGEELMRTGQGSVTPSEWISEAGTEWPVDPTVGNHRSPAIITSGARAWGAIRERAWLTPIAGCTASPTCTSPARRSSRRQGGQTPR